MARRIDWYRLLGIAAVVGLCGLFWSGALVACALALLAAEPAGEPEVVPVTRSGRWEEPALGVVPGSVPSAVEGGGK